jgi:starch synthase
VHILFPSSEVEPYSKTGGLADVAGALPFSLANQGHTVRVVTPLYQSVSRAGLVRTPRQFTLQFPFGEVEVSVWEATPHPHVTVAFLDLPAFFHRPSLYGDSAGDYSDNARRFAAFSMAALTDAQAVGFHPDILHVHDWQTGLMPLAMRRRYRRAFPHAQSVMTIHNLAYQGIFQKSVLPELGISWTDFTPAGVEFWDHLSLLKAGIVFSDAVTTVSPTYAKEITVPETGMGFDGVLRSKRAGVVGIVNGIDVTEWNPATDVYLPAHYSAADLTGRSQCRSELLNTMRLPAPPRGLPVFGVIGRMVEQKGADLLQAALPAFLEHGVVVVVLGSGSPAIEHAWQRLEARYPSRVAVRIGYDAALAHLIEAGSDFFVMPSRFEPCGLNQMYSQRYGSVPIVHAVGGLVDTVQDVATAQGTGIAFRTPTVSALQDALHRALELFRTPSYVDVQRRGMRQDFSWERSATAYLQLYESIRSASPLAR